MERQYEVIVKDKGLFGHQHVKATIAMNHEPTNQNLGLLLAKTAMSVDPESVRTAALSQIVRKA